ncbi:MAG: ATP-grasp domain-containing protein, partial [Planctomycetota bacterium]
MKIHEYQAKELFRGSGVPTPRSVVCQTAEQVAAAFGELGGSLAVVKSQIHAGGRGKGRFKEHPDQAGVVLVRSAEEAKENAARMLGSTLVTIQTGEEGKRVNTLLVEEGLDIASELYVAVTVDRDRKTPILIASSEGGMDIEEVAEKSPEKILKVPVDGGYGLHAFQATELAFKLGLEGKAVRNAAKFLPALARFFLDSDCDMAEINPLVVTGEGGLVALDAKVSFDGNALYRHKNLDAYRDLTEEDESEIRA